LIQLRQTEARRLKELGNKEYNESRFETAIEFYTDALAACLLCHSIDRAILYANRAAAKVKLVSFVYAVLYQLSNFILVNITVNDVISNFFGGFNVSSLQV
jgi:hypothetical protein